MKFANTFPIGAGDKYKLRDTGGEETHRLTEAEMPKHAHFAVKGNAFSTGDSMMTHIQGINSSTDTARANGSRYTLFNELSAIPEGYYWQSNTLPSGNSQSHNNMPPYYAVYFWKRTA